MKPLTVDIQVIKNLLNNLAENHGNIDVDIDLIESIVAGWSDWGHKPSLKYLADKLIDLGNSLIDTHDLEQPRNI